jgi:hypothetical protein
LAQKAIKCVDLQNGGVKLFQVEEIVTGKKKGKN